MARADWDQTVDPARSGSLTATSDAVGEFCYFVKV